MSKPFKLKVIIILFTLVFIVLLIIFFDRQGVFYTRLNLIGDKYQQLEINEIYQEQGIKVKKRFKDIQDVHIQSNLIPSKLGEYVITYSYQNASIQRFVQVVDTQAPFIQLKGENVQMIFQGEDYQEEGVEVFDNSKEDLSQKVQITHHIQSDTCGDYEVVYVVKDSSGNETEKKRRVQVVENPMKETLFYHYDDIDNTLNSWWFHKANDHERKPPTFPENLLKKYQAYYLGNDEKVIYLTFDEGGNTVTYIKEITDILNQYEVDATYFLTRNYVAKEADFMKQLVQQGHLIGNHTRRHLNMTTLANEQGLNAFLSELNDTQKTIVEVTQTIPPKIFRFPSGDYSERALAIVSDMGYKTFFWSHAYNDYGGVVSKEESYNNLVTHLHPGAIYLLHPANKGNYEAMADFIIEAKKQGYRFDLVTNMH